MPKGSCASFRRSGRKTHDRGEPNHRQAPLADHDWLFSRRDAGLGPAARLSTLQAAAQPVEIGIDHRRDVERQQLRQAAGRPPRTGPAAGAIPRPRRSRGRSAGCPSCAAMVVIMIGRKRTMRRFEDRLLRRHVVAALPLQREVDHHDGVLLHDADQHDHADKGVKRQRQCRQDRSVSSAPTAAEGRPDRMVSGWMKLSYRMPRMM